MVNGEESCVSVLCFAKGFLELQLRYGRDVEWREVVFVHDLEIAAPLDIVEVS